MIVWRFMHTCIRGGVVASLSVLILLTNQAFAATRELVAGYTQVPPLFKTLKGKASGFAVEVLNEAADRTGISLRWQQIPNSETTNALASRRIDIYPAGARTQQRIQRVYIAQPWWRTRFVVLTQAGRAISPHRPHVVGHAFEIPEEVRTGLSHWDIRRTPSRFAAVQGFCRGEFEAAIFIRMSLEETVLRRPPGCESVSFEVVDEVAPSVALSVLARREHASEADELSAAIESMADDGTLASIALRYPPVISASGEYISTLVQSHSRSAAWQAAAIILAVMLLLCAWLIIKLRMDIRRRLQTTLELQRAYYDLEQFAYASHHDLREPLRNMSLFSQILQRRGLDDPRAPEHLAYIVGGAERMSSLLDAVRSYMQIERKLPDEFVDSEYGLRDALADLHDTLEAAGAEVRAGEMPRVWFNREHLSTVFRHLIENAAKFGGKSPLLIRVSSQGENGHVIFSVADNGLGIEPAYQEKVFGVFKRLHSREIPGMGVGLAICRKIVEQRHGRIWIESAAGRGTTVRFTVPKAPRKARRLARWLRLH